jgi:hypothetical protein
MTSTNALTTARRLLTNGFVISAANVVVDDAKEAAREALEPPEDGTIPPESRRDALINALDLAVARLQQHRDAIRDGADDAPGGRPSVQGGSRSPKDQGRKKGQ